MLAGASDRLAFSCGLAAELPRGSCSAQSVEVISARSKSLVCMLPQVIDKDADAVLDEVEAAIYQAAVSILRGKFKLA